MEEEEEDDLELFGGYDSFRSYNSSAGSESSSYLEESSEAETEDREAGELPASPLPLLSPGNTRSLDGSGSEPGAGTVLRWRVVRRPWRSRDGWMDTGSVGPAIQMSKGLSSQGSFPLLSVQHF